MYLPPHFDASGRLQVLRDLVDRDPFATLVSVHDGLPFASHLPLLLEGNGAALTLTGHWARPNPQWKDIAGQTALAIFHGPHAYVSPTWYPDPRASVPTWNYAVAHLYGPVELVTDEPALLDIVDRLSRRFEPADGTGWRLQDTDASVPRMAAGIVGFRMPVQKVEVKLKLSQHHPADKRAGAIAGLSGSAAPGSADIARMMAGESAGNAAGT
jgi:transcriptional regulator